MALGMADMLSMGRSFYLGLIAFARIGASLFLSRRLCGSGAGSEVTSGQSRFFNTEKKQRKAEKSRELTGLKARLMSGDMVPFHYIPMSCAFNFDKTDPYNSGAGVESTPPALLLWRGREKKEM